MINRISGLQNFVTGKGVSKYIQKQQNTKTDNNIKFGAEFKRNCTLAEGYYADIHARPLEAIGLYLDILEPFIENAEFEQDSERWNPLNKKNSISIDGGRDIKICIQTDDKYEKVAKSLLNAVADVIRDPDAANPVSSPQEILLNGGPFPLEYCVIDQFSHYYKLATDKNGKHYIERRTKDPDEITDTFPDLASIPFELAVNRDIKKTARNFFLFPETGISKDAVLDIAKKEAQRGNFKGYPYTYYRIFEEGPYLEKLHQEEVMKATLKKAMGISSDNSKNKNEEEDE